MKEKEHLPTPDVPIIAKTLPRSALPNTSLSSCRDLCFSRPNMGNFEENNKEQEDDARVSTDICDQEKEKSVLG